MASELKLTNIKHPSSGSNNLVLASDGSATIANGTINAGTLDSSVVFPTKVKMGSYQFDQGIASGTIAITGIGFKPNLIEAWVNYIGNDRFRSFGYCRDVGGTLTQQCSQFFADSSNFTLSNYFASTSDATSGVDANMQKFAIQSFDSDGFTIANTKSGLPSSTHNLTYVVYFIGTMS